MGKLVKQLKEYLSTATREQLNKDWEELKHWNTVGITVEEFIKQEITGYANASCFSPLLQPDNPKQSISIDSLQLILLKGDLQSLEERVVKIEKILNINS